MARECTRVLGPGGYGGVQVSPPADSLSRDYISADAPIEHPWWEVYQPVDYTLAGRIGTEDQFKQMVTACRSAGVKVYVDTSRWRYFRAPPARARSSPSPARATS